MADRVNFSKRGQLLIESSAKPSIKTTPVLPSNPRPTPSDISKAQESLTLLKQKMTSTMTFNNAYNPSNPFNGSTNNYNASFKNQMNDRSQASRGEDFNNVPSRRNEPSLRDFNPTSDSFDPYGKAKGYDRRNTHEASVSSNATKDSKFSGSNISSKKNEELNGRANPFQRSDFGEKQPVRGSLPPKKDSETNGKTPLIDPAKFSRLPPEKNGFDAKGSHKQVPKSNPKLPAKFEEKQETFDINRYIDPLLNPKQKPPTKPNFALPPNKKTVEEPVEKTSYKMVTPQVPNKPSKPKKATSYNDDEYENQAEKFTEKPIAELKKETKIVVPEKEDIGPLIECDQGCGRSFAEAAIEVHRKICVKVFQKQRKKFDPMAQRLTDLEGIGSLPKPKPLAKEKKPQAKTGKMPKWQIESLKFRNMIKKPSGEDPKKGPSKPINAKEEKLMKEIKQMEDESKVKCKHCSRTFDAKVAERHIPFCKDQELKNKIKGQSKKAKK